MTAATPGTPATTPRPDRFRVLDDNRPRLIGRLDYCTCGGNPGVGGAQHEPHCGWDLIGYVDEILPAFAEILAARVEAAREEGRAERDAEIRALIAAAGVSDHEGGFGDTYYARPAAHMLEELIAWRDSERASALWAERRGETS